MRVYIYSLQLEIAELIADNLTDKDVFCIPFPTFDQLYEEIKNSKKYADLLILDYLIYNHESYSLTASFKENNIKLPIVWYNDPCIIASSRVLQWKSMILNQLTDEDTEELADLTPLENILQRLQDLVECEELRPYIPLMQKALPLPEKYIRKKAILESIKKNSIDNITNFRKRSKLSDSLYYLLRIFYNNHNAPLSPEDICDEYEKDNKTIGKKSLITMICNLRKAIREDGHCNFYIVSYKNYYTFINH